MKSGTVVLAATAALSLGASSAAVTVSGARPAEPNSVTVCELAGGEPARLSAPIRKLSPNSRREI